jgi:hypothetical protein
MSGPAVVRDRCQGISAIAWQDMIVQTAPDCYNLKDHLGGFSADLANQLIESLPCRSIEAATEYILSDKIKQKYPHIKFSFNINKKAQILNKLLDYKVHPELTFQNFVCSFNGSTHVSRKFLVAILHRFGYFDPVYSSKNFVFTADKLDGHLQDYTHDQSQQFYRKFFISDNCQTFFDTVYSFGHVKFDHGSNIYNLEKQLTQSFLHVVSESMATSYYPIVTEKFLYSVVTRGLFLSYAQPGWHEHVEKYYGFRLYNKLFDYRFDAIQNPVERLVELVSMISKFSVLSPDDWKDLYALEQESIEYNHNHYLSGDYLKNLKRFI